jgi:hypothetical protein
MGKLQLEMEWLETFPAGQSNALGKQSKVGRLSQALGTQAFLEFQPILILLNYLLFASVCVHYKHKVFNSGVINSNTFNSFKL